MQEKMKALVEVVSAWPGVSIHEHQFDGLEFRVDGREIGHIHWFGIVDIPFTVRVRDALIHAGRGERHHWLPESGWTTVRVSERWTGNARELLRLSYLRVVAKGTDEEIAQQARTELVLCGLEREILEAAGVLAEVAGVKQRRRWNPGTEAGDGTLEGVSRKSHEVQRVLATESRNMTTFE
jgi:hypothetical protein